MAVTSDVYHGTGVPITKEVVVDMKEVLYRLDPSQNPFMVLANMMPKQEAHNIKYEWMQREAFSRRTFPAKIHNETLDTDEIVLSISFDAKYWNAISLYMHTDGEDPAFADEASLSTIAPARIRVRPIDAGTASTHDFLGWIKRSAYEERRNGTLTPVSVTDGVTKSTNVYYSALQLSKDATSEATIDDEASEADLIVDNGGINGSFDPAEWDDGDACYVTVESHNMQVQGSKQGSGLGVEQYKISQHLHNFTQIFKSPLSITDTMKNVMYIGGDELTKRRWETGQSHATDIEAAIMFQAGGTEGTDWGIIDNSYAPKTRFKGLGVGMVTAGKAGWLTTNNPDQGGPNATLCTITTNDFTSYMDMMEAVYDDMKAGSQDKVMFCGTRFFKDLSLMALTGTTPAFTMNIEGSGSAASIGVDIKKIITPFGALSLIHHPMFAGIYQNYGLILDMKNISLRPLRGRDSKLHIDIGSAEIDGQIDEFRTEMGIEVRHEHTHAIVKIG